MSAKETCDASVWNAVWISPVISTSITLVAHMAIQSIDPRPSTSSLLGQVAIVMEPYRRVPVAATVVSISLLIVTAFMTVLAIRFFI